MELLEARSKSECILDHSFGGVIGSGFMWVTAGCRGIFRCGAHMVLCPAPGRAFNHHNMSCSCLPSREPTHSWAGCPSSGDLEDATAFAALIEARQSRRRDLTLLLYGQAGGSSSQLSLGDDRGVQLVRAQLSWLSKQSGGAHHLVVSPALRIRNHPADNLCLTVLRPRGICCGYSSVGIDHYPRWRLAPTHPFVLFALRFWAAARVVRHGTNVLYVDLDIRTREYALVLIVSGPSLVSVIINGVGWPRERLGSPCPLEGWGVAQARAQGRVGWTEGGLGMAERRLQVAQGRLGVADRGLGSAALLDADHAKVRRGRSPTLPSMTFHDLPKPSLTFPVVQTCRRTPSS